MTTTESSERLPLRHIREGAVELRDTPVETVVWTRKDAMMVDRSHHCYLNPEAKVVRNQFSVALTGGSVQRGGEYLIGIERSNDCNYGESVPRWEVTVQCDHVYDISDEIPEGWIKVNAIKTAPPRVSSLAGRD